jgi:hypothetical protein
MSIRGANRFPWRVVATLLIAVSVFQASCGTILYPERRGQPAGRLDIGVVLLDGLGLLLFFVPGVIAFAVDFATGAIYLPPEYSHAGPISADELRKIPVNPADLTPERIEAVVQEHTGKAIHLQPGQYRAMPLQKIEDVTPETLTQLQSAPAAKVTFRAKGE